MLLRQGLMACTIISTVISLAVNTAAIQELDNAIHSLYPLVDDHETRIARLESLAA